jgi:peroxiredoxin
MAIEIGDEAPDFELPDQHGTPVKLSSFRGAKNVVLVFYPLAFSSVCSGELCALREEFPEVNRDDVELITVSVDSMFAHRAWADAENFQFSLRHLQRGQGRGRQGHLRHRQERRRALVRRQPDPGGA